MKKIIKNLSVLFLALFWITNLALASETSGSINPGLSTGIEGIVVVAPSANVPAGTYTSVQNVSLAAIGSQSVRYTVNGDDPDCSSTVYSAPIAISSTSTLKAIACYGNNVTSNISSFAYEINLPQYSVPLASPLPGTYFSTQSVVLTAEGSSSIHYVTDSSALNCSSGTVYTAAIPVSSSQTIRAIACYADDNSSTVASFAYVISISAGGGGGGGGGGGTPSPVITTGDLDNNSKIDFLDFNILMMNWGNTGSNIADLNHDNVVDFFDFNILMINWGK